LRDFLLFNGASTTRQYHKKSNKNIYFSFHFNTPFMALGLITST
jgi:hypothetical protein